MDVGSPGQFHGLPRISTALTSCLPQTRMESDLSEFRKIPRYAAKVSPVRPRSWTNGRVWSTLAECEDRHPLLARAETILCRGLSSRNLYAGRLCQ